MTQASKNLTASPRNDVERFFELAIAEERRTRWRRVARLVLELLRLLGDDGPAVARLINARLGSPLNGGDLAWFRFVVEQDGTPNAVAAWAEERR